MSGLARRVLFAIVALALLPLFVAIAAVAALSTHSGQALLARQVERIAGTALGPDVAIAIGDQSLSLARFPSLHVDFGNLTVRDKRSGIVLATVGSVDLGLALAKLIHGDIKIETLIVEAIRLDRRLQGAFGTREPFAPGTIFTGLDGAFDALDRIGLDRLAIDDVAVSDAESTQRVETIDLRRESPGGYAVHGRATGFGRTLILAGSAQFDRDRRRLATLNIGSEPIDFGSETELAKPGQSATRFALPTRIEFALGPVPAHGGSVRKVSATLYSEPAETAEAATSQPGKARVGLSLMEGSSNLSVDDGFLDYAGVVARFSGSAALASGPDGLHPFSLRTSTLTSQISRRGDRPAEASFEIGGHLDMKKGALAVDRLAFKSGSGTLEAALDVEGRTYDSRAVFKLRSHDLATADILAFWPFFIAPDARQWALNDLERTGRVEAASLDATMTLGRLGELVGPDHHPEGDELRFAMDFEHVGFATLGALPKAREVAGHLSYTDGRTTVSLDEGQLADVPGVSLLPSSVEFESTASGTVASLALNVEGRAGELLAIADRDPIDALHSFGFSSSDFSGNAKVAVGAVVKLGSGRMASNLQGWSVTAALEGIYVAKPVEGRRITQVKGDVDLAPGVAIGKLTAAIDGIKTDVEFTQPFGEVPVGTASFVATARPGPAEISRLVPALAGIVDGPVQAKLTRDPDGMHAQLGLDAAKLTMPAIGWTKGAGVPASLAFDVATHAGGFALTKIDLSGDSFSASGDLQADAKGLKTLRLDRVTLNRGDDFAITADRQEDGILHVDVGGERIDVRALLSSLERGSTSSKDGAGVRGTGRADAPSRPVDAEISVRRLTGFSDESLTDARITYRAGGGRPLVLEAAAKTATKTPVQLAIKVTEGRRTVRLSTDDAGTLLRFSGLYARLSGGELRIALDGPSSGGDLGPIGGTLSLQHFAIVDEPSLASLVGSDGHSGLAAAIGKRFDTSRARFDAASVDLSWDGATLSARDGIVRGPVFGSSFEGVLYGPDGTIDLSGAFMPAYRINRLFGALPLVGGLLGNGDEGALIGITYRLSGAIADPTLRINPISAIAPGIFRRIFEY